MAASAGAVTTGAVDAWVITLAPGTYVPTVTLTGPATTTFSAGTTAAVCVDAPATVEATCTVSLSIGLTNLVCGAGYAFSSSSATVTIGTDTDTYTFDLVVLAGAGVLKGTLTDDTGTGPAAGVIVIAPGAVGAPETCLSLQHATVSAAVVGVVSPV